MWQPIESARAALARVLWLAQWRVLLRVGVSPERAIRYLPEPPKGGE